MIQGVLEIPVACPELLDHPVIVVTIATGCATVAAIPGHRALGKYKVISLIA